MLTKSTRLTRAAFDQHFKRGRRHHSDNWTIVTASDVAFHGAVVVGKKVHKKAVDRNTLRRRLYSALYRWSQTTGARGVFIILVKPAAAALPRRALSPTLTADLARVAKSSATR